MSLPDTPWRAPSSWTATPERLADLPDLLEVCVIGAGIAGMTTAYELARSGRQVVVLEASDLGHGETARSTAHLTAALDDGYVLLERLHGREGARLAAHSHAAAIERIRQIVAEAQIDCSFARVDGYLISATRNEADLRDELAAAQRAGLSVEFVTAVPGAPEWAGPALRFPRQARCDPRAYLLGLIHACAQAGVRFVTQALVQEVQAGADVAITLATGTTLHARDAVVSTNIPCIDRLVLQTKLESYRSYVVAARIAENSLPDHLLWDDADPYHYVRLGEDDGGQLLVVGGEDHRTGQGPQEADTPYRQLETWLRERYPQAGTIAHRWSGQIIEPVDALAYIGLNPGAKHIYVITGDSGNGMTHGTLGGMLISDLLCGRTNAWQELYRPSRWNWRALGEYARHNAQVVGQYGDWLGSSEVASADAIPCGGSAIVRNGLHPLAIHRTADGQVHACSAICPHLGGLVRWNHAEKTWDCPCHGSRFSAVGGVIHGPAHTNLASGNTAPPLSGTAVAAG